MNRTGQAFDIEQLKADKSWYSAEALWHCCIGTNSRLSMYLPVAPRQKRAPMDLCFLQKQTSCQHALLSLRFCCIQTCRAYRFLAKSFFCVAGHTHLFKLLAQKICGNQPRYAAIGQVSSLVWTHVFVPISTCLPFECNYSNVSSSPSHSQTSCTLIVVLACQQCHKPSRTRQSCSRRGCSCTRCPSFKFHTSQAVCYENTRGKRDLLHRPRSLARFRFVPNLVYCCKQEYQY